MKNLHNLLDTARTLVGDDKTLQAIDLLTQNLGKDIDLSHINDLAIQRPRQVSAERERDIFGSKDKSEFARINSTVLSIISNIARENDIKFNASAAEITNVQAANGLALTNLSRELALNYFTVSFSDRYKFSDEEVGALVLDDIANKVLVKDLADYFVQERNRDLCRNVFVIGAGATYNNFKVYPFGEEMRHILKEELKVNDYLEAIGKFKDGAKKNFKAAESLDFEKYISFLAKTFGKDKVTEKLKEFYSVKYAPCLSYEIIAHLLKHGFIDVVINFNFDELLDQAIEEEVGQGNYYKIVSDGDVISLSDIVVNGSLKIPVYIKAHGTASNKSTLSLTQNNYFQIPKEVSNLIEQLVSGKRENKLSRISTVNVTCIGYSMQSEQFNSILEEHLSPQSQIFNLNVHGEPSSRNNKIDGLRKGFVNLDYIEPQDGLSSFDVAMRRLWAHVADCFTPSFKPRQISRHEIISNIFYEYNIVGDENNQKADARPKLKEYFNFNYFLDRVIIEIGILIAKNKGILDFHEVMPERLCNYYHLYRKRNENREKKEGFTTLYAIATTVFKMIPQYDFSGNLLIFPPVKKEELPLATIPPKWLQIIAEGCVTKEDMLNKINETKGAQILFRYFNNGRSIKEGIIINKIIRGLTAHDADRQRIVTIKIKSTLAKLNYLVDDFVYDINPKFEDRKLYRFASFTKKKILHTNLALNYEVLSKFIQNGQNGQNGQSSDWNVLLMVSERGKTIKKALKRMTLDQLRYLKKKRIIMICAYEVAQEEVANTFSIKPRSINALESAYKNTLIGKEQAVNEEDIVMREIMDGIKILFIPYREHSNHMNLFLHTDIHKIFLDDNLIRLKIDSYLPTETKPAYVGIESVYYYKKGISNKINPMTVTKTVESEGKNHQYEEDDNRHLLKIFFKYYLIGRVFEKTSNMIGYISDEPTFTITKGESVKTYDLCAFIKVLKSGNMSELDGVFDLKP